MPTNKTQKGDQGLAAKRQQMLEEVILLTDAGVTICEACEKLNVTRSQFHKWRARRYENPVSGLQDLSRRAPVHSRNVSALERKEIIVMALKFPDEGCVRLQRRLKQEGIVRGLTTIQNVLVLAKIGSRGQRREVPDIDARLQIHKLAPPIGRAKILRPYRDFRERQKPGHSVFQSFFRIAVPERLGKLYLHFVCDIATELFWFDLSWGLGTGGEPRPQDVIALLKEGAKAAYAAEGVRVKYIFSDDQAAFNIRNDEPLSDENPGEMQISSYQNFLETIDIEYRIFGEVKWKKNAFLSSILKRLKRQFPDKKTLDLCVRERRETLRLQKKRCVSKTANP